MTSNSVADKVVYYYNLNNSNITGSDIMKCFLHIGTEKTGTTTLQTFFNLNRNTILEKGFYNPINRDSLTNLKLAVAAYNIDRRDELTKYLGIVSNDDFVNFQQNTVDELKHKITKARKQHPNLELIFISEFFQSRLTDLEEIQRLRKILFSFGINDISITVYLRDPAEIANSLFSTGIKCGKIFEIPPPPEDIYFNNVCNHKNTLINFANVFGESNLRPKIFEKSELVNASIIDDFLDTIAIPASCNYIIPENKNKALSLMGINITRRINKNISSFTQDKPIPQRSNIISYIEKHFTDSKYYMSKELFDNYDKVFKESNEWVRQKYFPHKKSLFTKKMIQPEYKSNITEQDINNISDSIIDILIDKEIEILNSKNN